MLARLTGQRWQGLAIVTQSPFGSTQPRVDKYFYHWYVPSLHDTSVAEGCLLSPDLGRSLQSLHQLSDPLYNWDPYCGALGPTYAPTPHDTAVVEDYPLSPYLRRSFQSLQQLSDLLPNWDSYGGLPPTGSALAIARRLLADIASEMAGVAVRDGTPYHIAPLADGGILLEWETRGNGDELAVDIGGRRRVRLPADNGDG